MLATLYLVLSLLVTVLFFALIFRAISSSTKDKLTGNRYKLITLLFFALWQVYTYLIASSGYLESLEFPPRFALFLILPLFIFTFSFLISQRKKPWIKAIPMEWLIHIQSFRILVEILFVMSVSEGVLHSEVTIEGYNFDMVFGATAAIIGFAYMKKRISEKAVLIWNYLGILVLASVIFVFTSSIYLPELYGYKTTPATVEFTKYPYILVAGFLMPIAVFIHVLSIVKYYQEK